MEKKRDTTKNYCCECEGKTNHKILFTKKEHSEEEEGYDWARESMVVECLGCGKISFRKDYWDEYQIEEGFGGGYRSFTKTEIYPKPEKGTSRLGGAYLLPSTVRPIYEESIRSLVLESFLLAGAGFRGVIEAICNDKKIKKGGLYDRINALNDEGYLSKVARNRLHSVRFLGNKAIHEVKKPRREQLEVVAKVINHLLGDIYILDNEIEGTIETVVSTYEKFEILLKSKLADIKSGEELPLKYFFGEDAKLFVGGGLKDFEEKLKKSIQDGKFDLLALGCMAKYQGQKKESQHFIVVGKAGIPPPKKTE